MGNSKEINFGGKSFVVDNLIEIRRNKYRTTGTLSTVGYAVETMATQLQEKRKEQFLSNITLVVSGSRSLADGFMADEDSTTGYTSLEAHVFYTGNDQMVEIPIYQSKAFTWSKLDETEPLASRSKTATITEPGEYQCTVNFTVKDISKYIGGSNIIEVDVSKVTAFTIEYGTWKMYATSNESSSEKIQSDTTLEWYKDPDKIDDPKLYLWRKETTNGGASWMYFRDTGLSGEDGETLSFDVSRTLVEYYADGIPIDSSYIVLTAKSNFRALSLMIDGTIVRSGGTNLIYSIAPDNLFKNGDSIVVTAYTSRMTQSYTITKYVKYGMLDMYSNKTSIQFYADNVPYDEDDKITLNVETANFKSHPKLYLDGVLQTTEDAASFSFDVPQSMFASKNSILAEVVCATRKGRLRLSKAMDVGSIDISTDRTVFGFYADNVPLNSTDKAVLTITQSGYSKMPTLLINGKQKEYTDGSYTINALDMTQVSSLTARIQNELEAKSVTIGKTREEASITLSLSEAVAEYYHDNVAITGDITATVGYSGLYYAPLLRIGDTPIALSDEGTGTIPISLFDSVDSGLTATAYAQKNIIYSTSVSVPKQKRPLVLSLGSSGSQFSYNSEGTASPASITLTNNTQGLSDKGKATLVVGGELKAWTDGAFTVTPDMIAGRYLAATISYGNDSSTMIITKTYDGKAETVEYSKTKSFRIYPDEEYEFTYSDTGLSYNGETMAWVVPWGTAQPDISSNEYLWRRSRNSDTDDWQYTRLTGIKGDDGKAGEYLGHYLEAPTTKPDGSDINVGDYYLNTSEAGSPLPYIYKDGQWTLVTADNPMWSQIASATIGDVNNYGGSLLSTSAYYGYFQALSAQKAFIKSLGTQEITLSEGGAIQSESYGTSGGAEGFRIGADGNVDFNSGIWRGSFANGLSFIPPTNVTIKKTMTQKEAYQALKKAGVAPGVYKTASQSAILNTGTYPPDATASGPSESGGYPSLRTGNGFTCVDYDSLDMQIPLFTVFNGIIPLDGEYMIGVTIDKESSSASSTPTIGAYLFTKSMAAKAQWNATEVGEDNIHLNMALLKSYPISELNGKITNVGNNTYGLFGTVVNGKIIIWDYNDQTAPGFKLYSVDKENMSLTLEGMLSLPDNCYLTRWLYPAFYYHEKTDASGNKYWETSVWTSASASSDSTYKIVKTTDLLTYTVEKEITSAGTIGQYNVSIPMDIVMVNGRVFALLVKQPSDTSYVQWFAEYNETSHTWDYVPDENTQHRLDEKDDTIYSTPHLVVRGNVIYGTYSTHEFFSYDTTTNTYKDLSDVFRTCLSYMDYKVYPYDIKAISTNPPRYAHMEETEESETVVGELKGYIGVSSSASTYTTAIDSTPDCIILKFNGTYAKAERTYSGSSEYRYDSGKVAITIADNAMTATMLSPYNGYDIQFYAASDLDTSTSKEDEFSVKTNGMGKTTIVKMTATNTDGTQYVITKTTTELKRYSKNMEWETLRIVALDWSESLGGIAINVRKTKTGEDSNPFGIGMSLVYFPDTGKATSLSPIVLDPMGSAEFGMLPLHQFAEGDSKYLSIIGCTILASEVDSADRMSFTMNNIRLDDLIPYANSSAANPATGIFFPNPSSVPFMYRSFAETSAKAAALSLLMKDKWEYDGERMFRTSLETLNVNCIVPFFHEDNMIVRETNEYYEIFLSSVYAWSYYMAAGFSPYPHFWGKNITLDSLQFDFYAYYSFGIAPNSNIYPILRIDKDSEEPVGATFIWDFPAQLTTGEDIKTVALSDFFNSRLAIGSKI